MAWDGTDSSSNSSSDSSSNNTSWKSSRAGKATKSAGKGLSGVGQQMMSDARDEAASSIHEVQYHRGGKVRKGGSARLLKGERVIPRGKVKKVERMMKKSNMRMKAKRGSRG